LMEGNSAIIDRREKFRQVSQAWHRFLQATSEEEEIRSGAKRKREDDEDDIPSVEMIRWKRLKEVDIGQQLKEMMGPEAEFRGQQEPALQAIMKEASPVLVIMGTGGGKTMLFQLPARSQKGGTTIVVVPLKSLEESLHERCIELGISSIQWDSSQQERMAQVVFVQPESAITASFARYLNRLQGLGQLVRVVFDECHTIQDSQPDFRPDMKKASAAMVRRGVQMLYLTATLAPVDEPEFMDIIKVKIPPEGIFRGSTSRCNVAYSVVEYEGHVEQAQAVRDLVEQKLEEYPTPAKIIIYSSSTDAIKELGRELGYPMYYADVGSEAEKKQIRQRWESGQERVVVASNAFGLGIDRPDVRIVIHVGPIYQMKSYGQESGRAGRDGERSEAIILVGSGQQEALEQQHERMRRRGATPQVAITKEDKKRAERERVDRFISGTRCRRIHLDQAMDGQFDRVRCEEGEEVCDVCQKEDAMVAEANRLQQAYNVGRRRSGEEQVEEDRHKEQAKPQQDPRLDSGIDIPSSSRIDIGSSPVPRDIPPSSPPIHIGPGSAERGQEREYSEDIATVDEDPTSPLPDCSSVVSLDQGFTSMPITIEEQFIFQVQQDKREQHRISIQSQMRQESRAMWEFKQQLEYLSRRCPYCIVRQLPHGPHGIRDCIADGVEEAREDWLHMRKVMRDMHLFSPYSCCFDCHVPQEICHKWVAKEGGKGSGRWVRTASNDCQFDEIIMPTIISIMREGEDAIQASIINEMQQQGIDESDKIQVCKWFGQKIEWGGIEVSRLVQVFHHAVRVI
jgi:superfamily II DNA helicase RecQ